MKECLFLSVLRHKSFFCCFWCTHEVKSIISITITITTTITTHWINRLLVMWHSMTKMSVTESNTLCNNRTRTLQYLAIVYFFWSPLLHLVLKHRFKVKFKRLSECLCIKGLLECPSSALLVQEVAAVQHVVITDLLSEWSWGNYLIVSALILSWSEK